MKSAGNLLFKVAHADFVIDTNLNRKSAKIKFEARIVPKKTKGKKKKPAKK
jgi:hypothetical protein